MGCFSGRLMSAASDQKLFCKLCSPFCCSFDEFVEEKVISPSYSSTILTPFFFFAIMNKAYLTMYKSLYGYVFLLLLGKFLEMKLLGSVKCLISMHVTLLNLKLPS